jgi:hypothetical protein
MSPTVNTQVSSLPSSARTVSASSHRAGTAGLVSANLQSQEPPDEEQKQRCRRRTGKVSTSRCGKSQVTDAIASF